MFSSEEVVTGTHKIRMCWAFFTKLSEFGKIYSIVGSTASWYLPVCTVCNALDELHGTESLRS